MEVIVQQFAESQFHAHDLPWRDFQEIGEVSEVNQLFCFKLVFAGQRDAGRDYSIAIIA